MQAKQFLGTADIAAYLGISRRTANDLMNLFAVRKQTVTCTETSRRSKLVPINTFVNYLCEQDHYSFSERRNELSEFLKEQQGGRHKRLIAKEA